MFCRNLQDPKTESPGLPIEKSLPSGTNNLPISNISSGATSSHQMRCEGDDLRVSILRAAVEDHEVVPSRTQNSSPCDSSKHTSSDSSSSMCDTPSMIKSFQESSTGAEMSFPSSSTSYCASPLSLNIPALSKVEAENGLSGVSVFVSTITNYSRK